MKLLVVTFLILPLTSALACINTPSGTTLNGGHSSIVRRSEVMELKMRMAADPVDATPTFKYTSVPAEQLSVRALELIYSGHSNEAIPLLQKAEETTPGDYSIAANLGTAFELVGDNKSALKWIQTAMQRNPSSHQGTEWVHVLILEAKLRDATKPGSSLSTPLIPVPERIDAKTSIMVGGVSRSATTVREALYHQLYERMLFVKPKDPYVSDLLFSLATIDANLSGVEGARQLLRLSDDVWVAGDRAS
jgi:tetratricopeptide (TPR) repeat protein